MEKNEQFYVLLDTELRKVLNKIQNDKDECLALKKPIDRPDTKYSNRITSCIMYMSNKYRMGEERDILSYYSMLDNAQWEYDRLMDINYLINCEYGIDYILTKKSVCAIFGMSIKIFQVILESNYGSRKIFENIEEYLISIRQESAENFTRHNVAIDSTLKTKGKFGGYNVEQVSNAENIVDKKGFNAVNASVEEIEAHLSSLFGGLLSNSNKK